MRYHRYTIPTVTILLAAACGSPKPAPVVPPRPAPTGSVADAAVDPEVARLYGDPPAAGRTPSSISWSPDGKRIAYLRRSVSGSEEPCSELWIRELSSGREQPLAFPDRESVDSFAWAGPESLVCAAGGDLLLVRLDGTSRSLTDGEEDESTFTVSKDGSRVAFVRDHDIYFLEVASGEETRITRDGEKWRSYGGVSWVYGEEFGTSAGIGLGDDGRWLWLYANDERETPHRAVVADARGEIRRQAYPRAGETNPTVRVGAVDLSAAEPEPVWMKTGSGPDVYLPQVRWRPDGKLAVTRIDRLQALVELLICDPASGGCDPVLEERDPRWVNLIGPPVFLEDGGFLWISERDGFAHVYRHDAEGRSVGRLTDGEWVVTGVDHVDEERGLVYLTGNADGPLTYGVYRAQLDGGGLRRVTPAGGVHSAVFSPSGDAFVDVHSALGSPPRADVMVPEEDETVVRGTLAEMDLVPYAAEKVTDELLSVELEDGTRLRAQLTRPRTLEPEKRYPVVVYVYGGPGAQAVRDHFRTSFQPWRDLMAGRGVLVFTLDGRGSFGRGREFETPIHRRLTEIELADQIAGVRWLRSRPFVDPDRIGVFGWSYGGTMTLAALLRSEGLFCCGAAVAPVTDWREYDTAYTERYMQRPRDNEEGYERTALVPLADRLEDPLLLLHGLADDNVHFANTARLVDALVKAGRYCELFVYPGKSHPIRGPEHRAHVFSSITRFFERHL